MFISWSVFWKGCFAVCKVKVTVMVLNFSERLPGQYLWSVKFSMVMHHHQPEYHSEISFCYVQTSVNVCPDNISDQSNLVWRCIIISQSIIQKYHFAMFKTPLLPTNTIVSTRSSKTLKLLQSKLVWWYIITKQGKTLWKDFLAFTQGMRQRIWLGWLWTRLLPLLAILISKAGVNTSSNQENVERTLLL